MIFKHTSVLYDACIENLNIDPKGIYVDGTLGGGGHASGICQALSTEGALIGIDRDSDALRAAEERLAPYDCKKLFVQSNYADIKDVLNQLGINEINGALLDLGVSSFQLDNEERGFSYMKDAPLDMRMSQDDSFTAYQVVNTYKEKELTEVIKKYGEEKWASRISRFIVEGRKDKPIETTGQLVELIKAAIPASARRNGPHPAKRTFQAIRIEVNDELGQLERAVSEFCDVLADKGRLCIITFHSLEDRIVKDIFNKRANPCTCPKEFPVCVCGKVADIKKVTGKPIVPTEGELDENPRARSAKLRVIEKKR
ncbi:16S rRNA (cytosine(1402)-N(4))-methyltransferase RsmH [Anaerovorax odorimutans]|uniref:Ribosomal RNA small subunit methyltransferase H n=1 Tax=Anaerovorax odorimutans TaxID=109327 RepID=A0ABT1RPW1_9FIRM|nr:16S rRNA (cytosine(1402)-N(4))-methyltransferase RsmH [Anaerovorax odorimutans]MCQ4637201.1 16S rRNA (cytosine(1402)-N(4))-methyltransferase RsmH [Anaerovorax odorimutans]